MAAKGASAFKNPEWVKQVVDANTKFAFNMYKELSTKKQGDNIFFSPVSVSTALAMTSLGARGNTETEMKAALQFAGIDEKILHGAFQELNGALSSSGENYTLNTANRLFGRKDYTFLAEFLKSTKDFYSAETGQLDFAADPEGSRQTINQWVEQQTNSKIKDLMPGGSINAMTALVLVNAIYFKGNWAEKFDPRGTRSDKFVTADKKDIQVQMMFLKKKNRLGFIKELNTMVLELPYVGNELSMYILLPKELGGLPAVEEKLTAQHLLDIESGLKKVEVDTYLPRFKLSQEFSLAETLDKMGMHDAFVGGQADLSGMDGGRQLFISKVMHKAFIEVNEEGSEAAAATGVGIMLMSLPQIIEFRACHPFLFLIRHNASGAVLFMGRVSKPDPEE